MAVHRWECAQAGRYYEVRIVRDLFGRWEILRFWGASGTSRGGMMREQVADESAIPPAMAAIEKRRAQRGYLRVRA